MADINGWSSTASGTPAISYVVTYSQIGRSASAVSYRFNFAVNLGSSGSTFGYTIGYHLTINGQTFNGLIKDNTSWSGTTVHNITTDVTVSCGSGGGILSSSFYTDRPNNDGTAGQVNTYGGYTVNVSSWNTAPYWNSGSVSIDQYRTVNTSTWTNVSGNVTIPENSDALHITWSGGADTEGGTLTYYVVRYKDIGTGWINDGTVSTTTSTSCTDVIGAGNQGVKYSYNVYIQDSGGLQSSTITSNTITKNKFTTATISTSSSIAFSTTSLTFSIIGASNTNTNSTFSYSLSCDRVTVYNPTVTPTTLTIWNESGNAPAGAYIKFSEIKSTTSRESYTGSFTFTVTTTNAYGTSDVKSCYVSVDIRTNPTTFTITSTGGYYTINSTNYYIPNRQNPTVNWGASTDQLGGSITYDIQVKLGNGSFNTVLTNLTTTNTSISIPNITSRTTCVFRVIAKTSYGYTSTADSSSITLDYYNPPTIRFNQTVRNITDTTVGGTIVINTSIPSINVKTLTYVGKTSGSLTLSTSFSKQETGLVDTDTYAFTITAQDDAGSVIGTSSTVASTTVPKYTPMFTIRELGVGVNALPDGTNKFIVGGNTKITGNTEIQGALHTGGYHNGILSYSSNGTNTYGYKIKTNIPFTNGTQMPLIMIEGFNYGLNLTIGLMINFYVYNDQFTTYGASSYGAWTPMLQLGVESGKVVIYISATNYYVRFGVKAFSYGMGEQNSWFEGWLVADESISGATKVVSLSYNNGSPYFSNIGVTQNANIDGDITVSGNAMISGEMFCESVVYEYGSTLESIYAPLSGFLANGDIGVNTASPNLILRDSDSTGNAQLGKLMWRDNGDIDKAYIGFDSTSNSILNIKNTYDLTNGVAINGNTIWHNGNVLGAKGSGYQKFPNGIIIQWGTTLVNAGVSSSCTFNIAFPSTCALVITTPQYWNNYSTVQGMRTSSFDVFVGGSGQAYCGWVAFGY